MQKEGNFNNTTLGRRPGSLWFIDFDGLLFHQSCTHNSIKVPCTKMSGSLFTIYTCIYQLFTSTLKHKKTLLQREATI
jgi:hypothetical protein